MSDLTNPVSKFTQPDFTSQSAVVYKTALDDAANVFKRVAGPFAPHARSTPNKTVVIDPGWVFVFGSTTVEVASQVTASIGVPGTNHRIDRVVVDRLTGVASYVSGVAGASAVPPAVPAGKVPVARIRVSAGVAAIGAADIYDERALTVLGLGDGAQLTRAQLQNDAIRWAATATVAGSTITATLSPAVAALSAGLRLAAVMSSAIKGSVHLRVNGLASAPVRKFAGSSVVLAAGDLVADQVAVFQYDGAVFQVVSPLSRGLTNGEFRTTKFYASVGSATWTKPSGLRRARVIVVGGGGGGGGSAGNAVLGGQGGGAGGCAIKLIEAASLGATEVVTVGAYGSAGTTGGGSGSDGSTSSFGSHCSATGGQGGGHEAGDSVGGTGSGGDINITGGAGGSGIRNDVGSQAEGGNGGSSYFGGGGVGGRPENNANGIGGAGAAYGSGGGGGGGSTADRAGGNGKQGAVLIEEYY